MLGDLIPQIAVTPALLIVIVLAGLVALGFLIWALLKAFFL